MAKPLKFHQTLNQAPRNAKHGQHRRSSPTAYRNPPDGAGDGAGRSDQVTGWTTVNLSKLTWTTIAWDLAYPEPAAPAIPNAGIRTGELIGHRLWWVVDGGYLSSLAHFRRWMPGETVHGDTHKVVGNSPMWPLIWGGTYAFFESGQLEPEVQQIRRAIDATGTAVVFPFDSGFERGPGADSFVVGTIKMWGDVVEHELGYRAEFAKLNSIDAIYGPRDIEAVRKLYGVGALLPP